MVRCYSLLCVAGLILAGCGTTATTVEQGLTLRVGVSPDYPPVIYKKDGQLCGIEADLATYVGAKMQYRIDFIEMPFEELVPRLERGEIDVIMSGMSDTDARRDVVRFTAPYAHIGQMALVRARDAGQYTAPGALAGATVRVGCLRGTTGELYVKDNMPQAECVAYEEPDAAAAALRARQVDVVIDDGPYVLYAVKQYPDVQALPWQLTDESLAWAVSKESSSDFLYERLNRIVLHARQNGDLRAIINTYFEVQVRAR
jgi:polar amino acid transport system substrate-binding protein